MAIIYNGVQVAGDGGLPANSQTFTSSGTFTVPAGVSKLWIRYCSGGGGGRGGSQYTNIYNTVVYASGGFGGSSCGYVYELLSVTAGSILTVTVGAGGAGGAANNGIGGTGGVSTVTNSQIGHTPGTCIYVATATNAFSPAGAGGANAYLGASKGSGTAGYIGGSGTWGNGAGGAGGAGGNGVNDSVNSAGGAGQGYGAGGGTGGGNSTGGAGYQGIVSIYW